MPGLNGENGAEVRKEKLKESTKKIFLIVNCPAGLSLGESCKFSQWAVRKTRTEKTKGKNYDKNPAETHWRESR